MGEPLNTSVTHYCKDETAMLDMGKTIGLASQDEIKHSHTPIVIYLIGQLGAGKTTLIRGFLRGLGVKDHIKSPTYTLVETYTLSGVTVHHFDLYRIKDHRELEWIGVSDYFIPGSICVIEWPEIGAEVLPASDITCKITEEQEGRRLFFSSYSMQGDTILRRFMHGYS